MSTTPTAPAALKLEVLKDGIGLIAFDLPGSRVNTLGRAVVAEFEALGAELARRTDLRGLLLRSGKPGTFIAGADIKEFGAAAAHPEENRQFIRRGLAFMAQLEALPYPTVALIDGACMGGGLEVALSFDQRLAGTHPKVEIGLPEVKLGIIPGWGGTQRLTRLIGPSLAAELICAGEAVKAPRARELGIVFDVVPGEALLDEGVRLIGLLRQTGDWKEMRKRKQQPVGLTDLQLGFAYAVAQAVVLEKTKGHYPAPVAALDAIFKGCNLPLEEGLKVEAAAFARILAAMDQMQPLEIPDDVAADLDAWERNLNQHGIGHADNGDEDAFR